MAIRVHIGSRLIESIDHCNTLQTDHLSAARHETRLHCIVSRNHVRSVCNYRTSACVVFRQTKIHSYTNWRRDSGREAMSVNRCEMFNSTNSYDIHQSVSVTLHLIDGRTDRQTGASVTSSAWQ